MRQASGFGLIAAAVCLAALGAWRISGNLATQATAGSTPAAIPAKTEEIKTAAARDLLTNLGARAEMNVSGANFVLANPNGLGLVLEIGEMK